MVYSFELMVYGFELMVEGLGLRVKVSGFGVYRLISRRGAIVTARPHAPLCAVWGLGFRA